MTSGEMAEGFLAQAAEILAEAQDLFRRGAWSLVVRRSQEVVEMTRNGCARSGRRRFTATRRRGFRRRPSTPRTTPAPPCGMPVRYVSCAAHLPGGSDAGPVEGILERC